MRMASAIQPAARDPQRPAGGAHPDGQRQVFGGLDHVGFPFSSSVTPKSCASFFLGVNDDLGLLQLALEPLVFAPQLGQFGSLEIWFWPAPPGRQAIHPARLALAAPCAQV